MLAFERLCQERLHKLQRSMQEREVGALLLTSPLAIRYATGLSLMPIWTAMNLARYAFVPAEGSPTMFEYTKALPQAQAVWPGSRPAKEWQHRFTQHESRSKALDWAKEIANLMKEQGFQGARLGIDTLDFHGVHALREVGITLTDADDPMHRASLTKTEDEIMLLRQSCAVAEAALYDLEQKIEPGVTENELLACFWESFLKRGGEYSSTRLLVSGEKTNPWFQEAGDRVVRPGDLIAIDTDMKGPQGYLCDISRTYLCGSRPNAVQKEAYRVAYDYVNALIELCRPGVEFSEMRAKAPPIPEEYQVQAYSCMVHGCGLDDEPPFVPFGHAGGTVPIGVIEPNMVLSVEFYAGKVGMRDGVKLEEQLLVTSNGVEILSRAPYDERLLA